MLDEARREELSALLRQLLGSDYVYYQPPENVKLCYPCIIYKPKYIDTDFANDNIYLSRQGYEVLVISKDPMEPVASQLCETLSYCRPGAPYTFDRLNHFPFTVYW